MRPTLLRLIVFATLVARSVFAQDQPLACASELAMPSGLYFASGTPGLTAKATVMIDDLGKPTHVEVESGNAILSIQLKATLTAQLYRPHCSSGVLVAFFEVRLQGAPTESPVVRFAFSPPNRFIFITQPRAGTIDPDILHAPHQSGAQPRANSSPAAPK
jgi:hypothetical protein